MNTSTKHTIIEEYPATSYEELNKFQKYRKQLDSVCHQIFQIIQECINYGVQSENIIDEVKKVSLKLQAQRFRVAVIGEFSQGKSTLINALLCEEIQPVRAIACSGTVTVLKYGMQQRIVCLYKDGHEEEISYEQYQILATISKEAARQHRSDELARSEIEEIIFEHPDLDLCKNGVEIIDSPGLNEHSDRATITQKLLKNADAVVFLTSASQALNQGERTLIQEMKIYLNSGKTNEPLTNLFLVVNKMDQLDSKDDWQDVQELVKEFAYGLNPVIAGQHRIHFISAKAALKAIKEKNENQYLSDFQIFIQALEKFLACDRGYVEIKHCALAIEQTIKKCIDQLNQIETDWKEKINFAELEKQRIIELLGEISGHIVRIHFVLSKEIEQLEAQVIKEVEVAWNEWSKDKGLLEYNLSTKAKKWYSNRDVVWDQHGIIEDYTKLFIKDLENEIITWLDKTFGGTLKSKISVIDTKVYLELKSIDNKLCIYKGYEDDLKNTSFNYTFNFDVSQKGLYGDLWRWITCILFIGYFFGSADEIIRQMKEKVIQEGLAHFREKSSEMLEKTYKNISPALNSRCELVDKIIVPIISNYEKCLEEKNIEYRRMVEQYEAEKDWIQQQRQKLKQVQKKGH